MKTHKTLGRVAAGVKLLSARRVVYHFRRKMSPIEYTREVPPEELARAFPGNPGMRLRIRLSDSQHEVLVKNRDAVIRYVVEF